MAYVTVKGGEQAIDTAHAWLAEERRGDRDAPELSLAQIEGQLGRSVDRAMGEGSLYDRELAALAVKQAQGDLIEAAFLLRAYRTTLPRFAHAVPIETAAMQIRRRISAVFKDLPGGQVLGPTYDYTHRLLDFGLAEDGADAAAPAHGEAMPAMPRVPDILGHEGLIEPDGDGAAEPGDLTRQPLTFPAARPATCDCRILLVATKASCWHLATRRSAATAARIRSPARSAWARCRWRSTRRNSASPSTSVTSPSPNARW
jgi:alpha-D-ribose 1-methylphosphonate 5-triphosphate synthase subunit PhnI